MNLKLGPENTTTTSSLYSDKIALPGCTEPLKVSLYSSKLYKCPRCWTHTSINEDSLCFRCNDVVSIDTDETNICRWYRLQYTIFVLCSRVLAAWSLLVVVFGIVSLKDGMEKSKQLQYIYSLFLIKITIHLRTAIFTVCSRTSQLIVTILTDIIAMSE